MENKLKSLFNYQRFEQNPRLAKLIAESEARFDSALSDDDLEFVSAAGEIENFDKQNKNKSVNND